MHTEETRNRFIELRAQGRTLAHIAAELRVTTRTLVEWNKQHLAQINDLQSVELEALQARVLASHEKELTRLATQLNQVESVLARRKLECLSTEFLFCLAGSLRAQIRKQCLKPAGLALGGPDSVSVPVPHSALPASHSNPASGPSTLNPQLPHERLPHQ